MPIRSAYLIEVTPLLKPFVAILAMLLLSSYTGFAADLQFLNGNRPIVDAHNCYPYDGQWKDRIDIALQTGFPVSIEQDLAWFVDPASSEGRVVVSHSPKTSASDPELKDYFFEKVRPAIEKALADKTSSNWPLIVLHFDFKDVQPALLHAVWDLLGHYQDWITTAVKTQDPHELSAFNRKPILVITEDSDEQAKVFYDQQPAGSLLRLFGSAHTQMPTTKDRKEEIHSAATLPPEQLLTEPPTTYRRWWNNSWYEVEEGGQPKAGDWTPAEMARLRSLVDYAHHLGYWVRFYTLDGFTPEVGRQNGWFTGYNFGSRQAVEQRWQAALDAGVNFIATDQYRELAAFMKQHSH